MAEARQSAQRRGAPAAMVRAIRGLERAAEPAALASRCMARADAYFERIARGVGRVFCRPLQPLLRAAEHRGRARRACRRRLYGASAATRRRRQPAALLWAYLPRSR